MQWAIGDWYNAIPSGDKRAACERAGIKYNSAVTWGTVASCFEIRRRSEDVPFSYYQKLAIQDLRDEQRARLLENLRKEKWSTATLVRERDKLLGKPERVPVQNFSDQVQAVLNQLPASASRKVKREVQALLHKSFVACGGSGGNIRAADEGILPELWVQGFGGVNRADFPLS